MVSARPNSDEIAARVIMRAQSCERADHRSDRVLFFVYAPVCHRDNCMRHCDMPEGRNIVVTFAARRKASSLRGRGGEKKALKTLRNVDRDTRV